MRIESLRAVLAVADVASFRTAAANLGVSQSSLSAAVAKLEEELGVRLLTRSSGGTCLSPAGEAARDAMRAVCAAEESLRRIVGAADRPELIRIAAVTSAINPVLSPALHDLVDDPRVEVQVRIGGSGDVADQVRRREADLGLITCQLGVKLPTDLHAEPLLQAPIGVAVPRGHRLAHATSIGLDDLHGERMIAFRAAYMMHDLAQRLSDLAGVRVVSHVESTPEAVRLVAAGVGMCFVPEFSVAPGDDVAWHELAIAEPETDLPVDDRKVALVMLRHAGAAESALAARLESRIRTHSAASANTAVRDRV